MIRTAILQFESDFDSVYRTRRWRVDEIFCFHPQVGSFQQIRVILGETVVCTMSEFVFKIAF